MLQGKIVNRLFCFYYYFLKYYRMLFTFHRSSVLVQVSLLNQMLCLSVPSVLATS